MSKHAIPHPGCHNIPCCALPAGCTARDAARFWARVEPGTAPYHTPALGPCWLWTGAKHNLGYGLFRTGELRYAHRVAYMLAGGVILDGFDIDHLCRVRACVNPAHLVAVTHKENVLRGRTIAARNARKTHCPQGHEYTPENTYVERTRYGTGRKCKACQRERAAA